MSALPCPNARALAAGEMTAEAFFRHLPCAACATIGTAPPLAVGTQPEMPAAPPCGRPGCGMLGVHVHREAADLPACGIAGCGEVVERCGAHLQDRIAASMRRDAAEAASLPVRTGGRKVPDDEMRGRAWSAGRVR